MYRCEDCGRSFNQRSEYIRHKDRKVKCIDVEKKLEIRRMLEKLRDGKKFRFIDLFSGIGGFHVAGESYGGQCVFASDIDSKCREIYKKNFGLEVQNDITLIEPSDIPDHEVLFGGFPCQSFSNAGKRKGTNDKRGILFDNIISISKVKKPKLMILENVKHILKVRKYEECKKCKRGICEDENCKDRTNNNPLMIEYIAGELDNAGYNMRYVVLDPTMLGVPQKRERVFFVCLRKDLGVDMGVLSLEIKDKIELKGIFEENVDDKYKIEEERERVFNAWDEMIKVFEKDATFGTPIWLEEFGKDYDITGLAKWRQKYVIDNRRYYEKYKDSWDKWIIKYKDLLNKNKSYKKLEWQAGKIKEGDSIWNYYIQFRQSGIRVKRANYFPTLVAMVQIPIVGRLRRYLTPRECARLQSYPDNLDIYPIDRIAYKQMGNSVNVDLVKYVLGEVLKYVDIGVEDKIETVDFNMTDDVAEELIIEDEDGSGNMMDVDEDIEMDDVPSENDKEIDLIKTRLNNRENLEKISIMLSILYLILPVRKNTNKMIVGKVAEYILCDIFDLNICDDNQTRIDCFLDKIGISIKTGAYNTDIRLINYHGKKGSNKYVPDENIIVFWRNKKSLEKLKDDESFDIDRGKRCTIKNLKRKRIVDSKYSRKEQEDAFNICNRKKDKMGKLIIVRKEELNQNNLKRVTDGVDLKRQFISSKIKGNIDVMDVNIDVDRIKNYKLSTGIQFSISSVELDAIMFFKRVVYELYNEGVKLSYW